MNKNEKMTEMEKFLEEAEIIRGALIDYFDGLQDSLQKIFDCEHPDLTEKERSYLFSIIKPFRDRVIYIGKFTEGDDTDKSFIEIGIDGDLEIVLPSFAKNQMYLGMQEDRKYALKELEM